MVDAFLMTGMVLAIAIIAIVLLAVRDAYQQHRREESRPIEECIAVGFMLRKFYSGSMNCQV